MFPQKGTAAQYDRHTFALPGSFVPALCSLQMMPISQVSNATAMSKLTLQQQLVLQKTKGCCDYLCAFIELQNYLYGSSSGL